MSDNAVPFEVAESCLSHVVGSKVSRAYNRTDGLELRRPVMERWSAFCCGETVKDNVIDLPMRLPVRAA
jgi:hypothetical protein